MIRWHYGTVDKLIASAFRPPFNEHDLKRQTFAGSVDQVRQARSFVGRVLDDCPVADVAALLASELATNAIIHTASGKDGKFAVIVHCAGTWARVEVWDEGSVSIPVACSRGTPGESGYGLGLVELMASRWGQEGGVRGRVVWFELEWE
jgi:anti-sigma regulatory factor (Ser/Thr protein kinase)